MFFTGHNNWYQWGYDNKDWLGRRTSIDQTFNSRYITNDIKSLSFTDALDYNLKTLVNDFSTEKYALLLSGGSESETTFRTFIKNKVDFTPYIFRYENDSNIYDVSYAITLCESHEKKYNLIDLNLKNFFENDAEKISEYSQIDRPRMLPQLKFLDYIDEMPIGCHGEPSWHRMNHSYDELGVWVNSEFEFEMGWDKYARYINRTAVMLWFKYTPELALAYNQTPWIKMLINDKFYGKLGPRSTKLQAYKEVYPEMLFRKKQTGFELVDDLINEFEGFLYKKYNGFPYRGVVQRTLGESINLSIA
jgi:hypothetical protein